jgi:hypothetical protein
MAESMLGKLCFDDVFGWGMLLTKELVWKEGVV